MWTEQIQKDLSALVNEEVLAGAILRYRGYSRKAIAHAAGSVLGRTLGQLVNGEVINEVTRTAIEKGSEKVGERWEHNAEDEGRNELPKLKAMLLAVSSTRLFLYGLKSSFWTGKYSVDQPLLTVEKSDVRRFEFSKSWPIKVVFQFADGREYSFEAPRDQYNSCQAIKEALGIE